MKAKGTRLLAILALATVLTIPGTAFPQIASAYSCYNCYGIVDWTGNVDGAFTSIVYLPILSPGDNHANIELWLIGPVPSGQVCPINGQNRSACWIELGAKAGPPQCNMGTSCYFWNDLRPCNGCYNNYFTHWWSNIPSGDLNYQVDLRVERQDSSDFALFLQSRSYILQNTSTGNSMKQNHIEVGSEVQGSTGAAIGATTFQNNQWKPVGANYYNFQTNSGSATVNSPIVAYWYAVPVPGNNGGIWYTYCPC